MTEPLPPTFLRTRGRNDETTIRTAMRSVLSAAHLLGLATGVHLSDLRTAKDPLLEARSQLELAQLQARLAWTVVDLLIARFARLPERRRPHFTPAQRFQILEIKNMLGWSVQKAADVFLLCGNTIANWERQADPHAQVVGCAVNPTPPVRRAADVVRQVVVLMTTAGFGGADRIARTLARAGWRLSARSVARYRRERQAPAPQPTEPPARRPNPVRAAFRHHTWMLDISEVQFLGGTLYLAATFDSFSRAPLVVRVFDRRPTARDMVDLLRSAARAFEPPRYVITDRGGEFTAVAFRKAVVALAAQHRLATADSILATAQLERFWRTLKQTANLRGVFLPLCREDLERRLAPALLYYLVHRPHEGLRGATPAEVFLGLIPAHEFAHDPPRGRHGDPSPPSPFRIDFLDPHKTFPVLASAA